MSASPNSRRRRPKSGLGPSLPLNTYILYRHCPQGMTTSLGAAARERHFSGFGGPALAARAGPTLRALLASFFLWRARAKARGAGRVAAIRRPGRKSYYEGQALSGESCLVSLVSDDWSSPTLSLSPAPAACRPGV